MDYKTRIDTMDFRNRYGYNVTEPINFISLLNRLDILAIFKPLSEDFSGISIKIDNNRFMMVNCDHSLGRQNFTIAHELYHLYFDKSFEPHKCQTGLFPKNKPGERIADNFAAQLLLPEEGLLQLIPENELEKDKIQLSTILKLEQTYGSSRLALLNQLGKMELTSKGFAEKYQTSVKTIARQHGYSIDLYEPTAEKAILGTYGSLATKLFEKEQISESHYLELMMSIGVDVNETSIDDEH